MELSGLAALTADEQWDASGRSASGAIDQELIAPRPYNEQRPTGIWHAGAEAARYGALLEAVYRADAPDARHAARALLLHGADASRVYRAVARRVLPRAVVAGRDGTAPHGLWALNATLFLYDALPGAEGAALMGHAVGLAVAGWPASVPTPSARPLRSTAAAGASSSGMLTDAVRGAALAGDAAGAECALAALLAGPSGGALPDALSRRHAYAAVLEAAAQAEARRGGWGHVLVGAHHGVEMAELLLPAETLLALRPALAATARSAAARTRPAPEAVPFDSPQARCAVRLNRRPARPGETFQWACALRAGPVTGVVEEALVTGLEVPALLDATMLAIAQLLAMCACAATDAGEGARSHLAALAIHSLLALHAARRARTLAPPAHDAIAAALSLLDRTVRRAPQGRCRSRDLAAAPTRTELARAAASQPAPHTLALVEAILAEYDEIQQRDTEVASELLQAAGIWFGRSPSAR